jgi:hypothetical protein
MEPITLEGVYTIDEVIAIVDAAMDTPGFQEDGRPVTKGKIIDLIDKVCSAKPKRRPRKAKKDALTTTTSGSPSLVVTPRPRGRPRKAAPDAASIPASYTT